MRYQSECKFQEGGGISYSEVYHLLWGTKKPVKLAGAKNEDSYFHDADLVGYGWGSTDEEVKEINGMELSLGSVPAHILDLRAMVDFCCIWRYDYPERIHHICKAIGSSGDTVSRCHYQVGTDKRDELIVYARALERWLGKRNSKREVSPKGAMEDEIERRVFSMLGERDELKELLVERTLLGLANRHIDCSFFGSASDKKPVALLPCYALDLPAEWRSRMRMLEDNILKKWGAKADDFLCEVGGAEPPCHFKFIRRLEILIGSIGVLKWRGYLPPKDSKVSGRRELTTRYLSILHAYWTGSGSGGQGSDRMLCEELFSALGESTPAKRWLIASLWKNIQNQTRYQGFTIKRWVEFVQIIRRYTSAAYDEV